MKTPNTSRKISTLVMAALVSVVSAQALAEGGRDPRPSKINTLISQVRNGLVEITTTDLNELLSEARVPQSRLRSSLSSRDNSIRVSYVPTFITEPEELSTDNNRQQFDFTFQESAGTSIVAGLPSRYCDLKNAVLQITAETGVDESSSLYLCVSSSGDLQVGTNAVNYDLPSLKQPASGSMRWLSIKAKSSLLRTRLASYDDNIPGAYRAALQGK